MSLPSKPDHELDPRGNNNIQEAIMWNVTNHINEAFARLASGKARYRILLDADF
jgi:hypothetical protein